MLKVFSFLIICFLLFSCASTPEKSGEPELSEGERLVRSKELTGEARIKLEQQMLAEVIDLANAALLLDPENGEALYFKAQAYMELGKIKNAIEMFGAAKPFYTRTWQILVNLAICYRELEDISKAKELLDEAYEMAPNDPWVNSEIGWLYVFKLNDPEKGIFHLNIGIEEGSNHPWIFYNIAIAYEKTQDNEKFLEYLYKAKALLDEGQGDEHIKRQIEEKLAQIN